MPNLNKNATLTEVCTGNVCSRAGLARDRIARERDLLWSRESLALYLTDTWWEREKSCAGFQGINDHAVAANLNYVLGDREELHSAVEGIATLMRWTFIERVSKCGPSNALLCLRAGLPWVLWSGNWELAANVVRYPFSEHPNTVPVAEFPESEMKRWCYLAQWLSSVDDRILTSPEFLVLAKARNAPTRTLAQAMCAVGASDCKGFNSSLSQYIEWSLQHRCNDWAELISPDATALANIAENRGILVALDHGYADCIAMPV